MVKKMNSNNRYRDHKLKFGLQRVLHIFSSKYLDYTRIVQFLWNKKRTRVLELY